MPNNQPNQTNQGQTKQSSFGEGKVGNNMRKDEPTAKRGEDNLSQSPQRQ